MYQEADREEETMGKFNCSFLFPTIERDTKRRPASQRCAGKGQKLVKVKLGLARKNFLLKERD